MTPDHSVWLTVARLVEAEEKCHRLSGSYGTLVAMTNMLDGLPPATTTGRIGSYVITIELTQVGFILQANPEQHRGRRVLPAFYGDQTGRVTIERSGRPADPNSERL